jgi:hypothetical protein
MLPAFVVVGIDANATNALFISQVVLGIALPFPMIARVAFTRRRDSMGSFANGRSTNLVAITFTNLRAAAQYPVDAANLRRADRPSGSIEKDRARAPYRHGGHENAS